MVAKWQKVIGAALLFITAASVIYSSNTVVEIHTVVDFCHVNPVNCKNRHCVQQKNGRYMCFSGANATTPSTPKLMPVTRAPRLTSNLVPKTTQMPIPKSTPILRLKPTLKPTPIRPVASRPPLLPTPEPIQDIQVVYTFDENSLKAVLASMNSVLASTRIPVIFHLIVCGELSEDEIMSYLNCFTFARTNYLVKIQEFDTALLDDTYMRYQQQRGPHKYLQSCGNYARFFIPRLLRDVELAIYIDVDIVVRKDLASFIREADQLDKYPLAFLDRTTKLSSQIWSPRQPTTSKLYLQRYNDTLDYRSHAFNAGFYIANLTTLRKNQKTIDDDFHFWMEAKIKYKLWYAGTQTLMLLTFYKNIQLLKRSSKYIDGLGGASRKSLALVEKASLLHWNGGRKPWKKQGHHIEVWESFLPKECSQKTAGKCLKQKRKWQCVTKQ